MRNKGKKGDTGSITGNLTKDSQAHIIDVNGKDTKLVLAVKSNILCYSLIQNQFLTSYEGHANDIHKLKYMEYTVDQKKEIDEVKKEYFMSMAENEQFCNIWKASKKEEGKTVTSPLKMLELTDKKECNSIQMKQIAGQYYFATCVTTHSVWGYICNLKAKNKDNSVLKKCDFKVTLDNEVLEGNLFIITSNIINESELIILKGNMQALGVHYVTYLDEEGQSAGTDIRIHSDAKPLKIDGAEKNGDVKMLGLEYDQIQQKAHKGENGILNNVNLEGLEGRIETVLRGAAPKKIKTGSLVAVLEQSLHANDIETINWVLCNTDIHIITETVKKVNKEALQQLMQNILIKLQQGVQKASLLWMSIVLKLRWIDVIKFLNSKATMNAQQPLSTIHTYLNRKTKNLSKYYEVRAKLQMVVESGHAMAGSQMDVDEEEKEAAGPYSGVDGNVPSRALAFQKDESSDDEDVDEVVEDVDQVVSADESDADIKDKDLIDSDDESRQREELEQYGDDVFEDEGDNEDLEMDDDEDDEDVEDYE